jgi:hypothetical protein
MSLSGKQKLGLVQFSEVAVGGKNYVGRPSST